MDLRELYGGISEVRKASVHRLDDATAAFDSGRWRACLYLAGYAVECRLKVALMKKFGCRNLWELGDVLADRGAVGGAKEVYTHSLEKLLTLTERAPALRANLPVVRQFRVVNRWVPAWRYSPDLSAADEAATFLAAAREVLHWIDTNV